MEDRLDDLKQESADLLKEAYDRGVEDGGQYTINQFGSNKLMISEFVGYLNKNYNAMHNSSNYAGMFIDKRSEDIVPIGAIIDVFFLVRDNDEA
jgi:hypothetical protein